MRPLSNFGTPPVGTDDYSQDIVVALQESTFEWRWAKRFGGSDFQEIANIAIEPDESVVVAGTFVGALDFGGGTFTTEFDTDMFLAKLDANGSHVWSRSFGNDSFNTAHGMATGPSGEIVMVGQIGQFPLDLGGGPLTPDYGGDAFVARYDASGAQQWSHLYGDEYTQRAVAVAIQSYGDLSGQVVVAGEFSGGLDFDSGSLVSPNGFDIFIVCFDSAGVPLWSRSYGGDGQQYVTTLAVDPASGRIAVVGTFDGTIDFGGGTLTGTTHYEPYIAVF